MYQAHFGGVSLASPPCGALPWSGGPCWGGAGVATKLATVSYYYFWLHCALWDLRSPTRDFFFLIYLFGCTCS